MLHDIRKALAALNSIDMGALEFQDFCAVSDAKSSLLSALEMELQAQLADMGQEQLPVRVLEHVGTFGVDGPEGSEVA